MIFERLPLGHQLFDLAAEGLLLVLELLDLVAGGAVEPGSIWSRSHIRSWAKESGRTVAS